MRNAAKRLVENIKTHFMLYIFFFFFENHSSYQVVRKNVVTKAADEDEMHRRKNALCMAEKQREDKYYCFLID